MHVRPLPALQRHAGKFFVAFFVFTVWAFWPSYFARLFEQPNIWFHAHGIVLLLWLAMLVAQAQLIRTRRNAWHRRVGKLSYVLAPAVIVVTTIFIHQRIGGGATAEELARIDSLPTQVLYFLALTLVSLIAFGACYGAAIAFRHDSQRHARWMIASVFPLFTPVTDRLIGAHVPSVVALVPQLNGSPILPVAGFLLADLLLLALTIWDYRANGRRDVFPLALGVLLLYHVGTLTLHSVPLWNTFGLWFLGLPLS